MDESQHGSHIAEAASVPGLRLEYKKMRKRFTGPS
jgi:hypothetical protein